MADFAIGDCFEISHSHTISCIRNNDVVRGAGGGTTGDLGLNGLYSVAPSLPSQLGELKNLGELPGFSFWS